MINDKVVKNRVLDEYFELNTKIIKLTNFLYPVSENQLQNQNGVLDFKEYKKLLEQLYHMAGYSQVLRGRLEE